ncbi:hypothetical protein [Tunicatimonas pelagia]|uniref:hypothetical protein n=1 Tax=Tunicatimonas pelagia TaxID=931531 RepID=UPI00266699A7|nr:hypothetical protein [Tunicatimonas pelagia]WKN43899.1 hypothetical protein P0M28_02800 [Tunicatimonas pelagia]
MDELQALWRKASTRDEKTVSPQEVEVAISRRSSDELEKFRRAIKHELLVTWPVLFATIVGAFWLPTYWMGSMLLVVFMGCLIYFYRQSLRQFDKIHYEDNLKTYLQEALHFLKSYVRHYKVICGASVLVGFWIGIYIASQDDSDSALTILVNANSTAFMVGAAILALGCLGGTHLYIKHLYQARINRLEQLLKEISEY